MSQLGIRNYESGMKSAAVVTLSSFPIPNS